jgi:dipeptidase D
MSNPFADLKPKSLWDAFYGITQVPRPSKHEEAISAHVEAWAAENNFKVLKDPIGNLVIKVPATAGRENAAPVVIQGHLDMVCEKNKDTEHDFMNEPIHPRIEGEWVYATGTTLGADNGVGVAAGMAAATDTDVVHGPLELLFTIDEETGLTGAKELDASMVSARTMLNLDAEEDGVVYVGCAGGADIHTWFKPEMSSANNSGTYSIEITGLRGGHSGLNIIENRGNAVKLLVRTVLAAQKAGLDIELVELTGGDKHNAIPRESEAIVCMNDKDAKAMQGVIDECVAGFGIELKGVDDRLKIEFGSSDRGGQVMVSADRDRLLRALDAIPHGVLAMSNDLEGLVETSNNLAAVKVEDGEYLILTSCRSSILPAIEDVLSTILSISDLAGFRSETQVGYPGWKPDMDSAVLEVVRKVYAGIWKKEPEVTAIHAGLECGLLGDKVEGMDMVSFGPQIEGAHSPEERLHIESTSRFWEALKQVLAALS